MVDILYIDDEAATERFKNKAELLAERGYNVIEVASVAELQSSLNKHLSVVKAIVLDILMPPLDVYSLEETNRGTKTGLFVLRDIRKVNKDIPIMIVSVKQRSEVEAQLIQFGVAAYLERPVLPSAIADELDRLTSQKGK